MQMDNKFPSRKVASFCSLRFGLCLLLHFCNVVTMSQRACLSLTMVAMVNSTDPHGLPNTSTGNLLDNIKNPRYNWSPEMQGVILTSISYGMLVILIPAGYFSGIYSIRRMVGCALFLNSLFTLLVPLAAEVGETSLIACRVVQGMSQGLVSIAQHVIWTKWAPPLERGRLTSLSGSGFMLGPFVSLLATGLICQSLGWPMVFYILGRSALSSDGRTTGPEQGGGHGGGRAAASRDPAASNAPLPQVSAAGPWLCSGSCCSTTTPRSTRASAPRSGTSSPPPWRARAMLTSVPIWAISFGCFAFSWTNSLMFFYSPTFLSARLRVSLQENGLLAALPYLLAWLLGIAAGEASDLLLCRNALSTRAVRKLFTTLGLLLPAVFGLCLCRLSSGVRSTVAFLTLTSASPGFCVVGMLLNPLDVAPGYYGFIKGVTLLIGMTGGLTSSTLAGIILHRDPESAWSKIFYLMAAINVTSLVFYLVFAKAEIQDWAKERQHTRL